jgi:hypothetical protein
MIMMIRWLPLSIGFENAQRSGGGWWVGGARPSEGNKDDDESPVTTN